MKARFLFAAAIASSMSATSALASVEINANPTKNMNCSGGVCSPTAKSAVLNTTDLANMLATSDVKITTGNGAVTITVSGPFSWTSTHRLTLDASLNVSFRAPVEVAGQGAVTIVTNDGGSGGDLLFFPGGSLDFWDTTSKLTINAMNYVLVDDVITLAQKANSQPSGNLALAKNYDAANDKRYRDCPVTQALRGSLEGLGHSIQNLTIMERGRKKVLAALFSGIAAGGVVRDIQLINGKIFSAAYDDGGGAALLAAENDGTIIHVSVSGAVQANYQNGGAGGGLVSENTGIISDSQSSAAVYAGEYSIGGGLAAHNSGSIYSSAATGTVYGGDAGGLIGWNAGDIALSHATGSVYGSNSGGLAGVNGATISSSFATGPVSGAIAGGLVGSNGGTVSSTYATGAVTATYQFYAGGLIGQEYGNVQNSYAMGAVNGANPEDVDGGLIGSNQCGGVCTVASVYSTGLISGIAGSGGLVGTDQDYQHHDFKFAYWDIDTSGMNEGAGWPANDTDFIGLTDAQLKSGLPAGFDPAIWARKKSINNGYPYLIALPPQ